MPLPKVKPSEDKETFIERCMSSASIQNEFKSNEQRLAVCNAIWSDSKSEKEETTGHFVKIEKQDPIHRVVKGVVYTPGDVDTDSETATKETIQRACWNFLAQRKEKNIDIQHDWQKSGCYVVESYIAEKDDPNFIAGSWIMAVKCSDEIFDKVVKGELNGFSFGGYSNKFVQRVMLEVAKQIVGETNENLNKDIIPAHKHQYILWYDNNGKLVKGHTDTVDSHAHKITYGTATDVELGHSHGVDITSED